MDRRRVLRYLVLFGPAVVLSPYLLVPPPGDFHLHREVAGYFQALAYWREPLASFTYLTPAENLSALHFHSLLSSPLVGGLGWAAGGRLVSLAMAVVSAYLVYRLVGRWFSDRAGLLAAAVLWVHPLFRDLAVGFMPETTSIALTTGALLAADRTWDSSSHLRWWGASTVLLVLAITTHMWEAVILLPIVAVFLAERRYKYAVGSVGVGVSTVGLVLLITELQPGWPGSLARYGVFGSPTTLLTTDYWLAHGLGNPVLSLGVPAGWIALAGLGAYWWRHRDREVLVVGTWLAAGLAIPTLLAGGFRFHSYYQWAILAPLAAVLGVLGVELAGRVDGSVVPVGRGRAVRAAVGVLLVVSAFQIATVQLDLGGGGSVGVDSVGGIERQRLAEVAGSLRERNVTDRSTVVFVGEWGHANSRHYGMFPAMGTILVDTGWLVRARGPAGDRVRYAGGEPRFFRSAPAVDRCRVAVRKHDREVTVSSCRPLTVASSVSPINASAVTVRTTVTGFGGRTAEELDLNYAYWKRGDPGNKTWIRDAPPLDASGTVTGTVGGFDPTETYVVRSSVSAGGRTVFSNGFADWAIRPSSCWSLCVGNAVSLVNGSAIEVTTAVEGVGNDTGSVDLSLAYWEEGHPDGKTWVRNVATFDEPGETTTVVDGLDPNTSYVVRSSVVDGDGDTVDSEAVVEWPSAAATRPGPCSPLCVASSAAEINASAAVVTTNVTDFGNVSGAVGAYYAYWELGDPDNRTWISDDRTIDEPGTFTKTLVGLDPGEHYVVRSFVNAGDGTVATADTVVGWPIRLSASGCTILCANASASAVNASAVTVRTNVTGFGGAGRDEVGVYYAYWEVGDFENKTWVTDDRTFYRPGTVNRTVGGLDPGTTYVVRTFVSDRNGATVTADTVVTTAPS